MELGSGGGRFDSQWARTSCIVILVNDGGGVHRVMDLPGVQRRWKMSPGEGGVEWKIVVFKKVWELSQRRGINIKSFLADSWAPNKIIKLEAGGSMREALNEFQPELFRSSSKTKTLTGTS